MLRMYHHATSNTAADNDVVVGMWRGGVSSS